MWYLDTSYHAAHLLLICCGILETGEHCPCFGRRCSLLLSHAAYVLCKVLTTWLSCVQQRSWRWRITPLQQHAAPGEVLLFILEGMQDAQPTHRYISIQHHCRLPSALRLGLG